MSGELLPQFQRIAESLLGEITWQADACGFCRCPGVEHHTSGKSKRDCRVYLDGNKPPTLYCVHTSCAGDVADKNRALRSAIGRAEWEARRGLDPTLPAHPILSPEERARRRKAVHRANVVRRAARTTEAILREHFWPVCEMISPQAIPGQPAAQQRLFLDLFGPDDVLWIGDRKESGHTRFARCFRTAAEWRSGYFGGPLMSASTFRPGAFARTRENVVSTPFLVVESDTLTRDEIGAVFRWLVERMQQQLCAIIDTGGRSLHGWFDQPALGARRDDMLAALEGLGCDPGPWRQPSMSRLPGAWRLDGGQPRLQRLLWINKKGGGVEGVSSLLRTRAFSSF